MRKPNLSRQNLTEPKTSLRVHVPIYLLIKTIHSEYRFACVKLKINHRLNLSRFSLNISICYSNMSLLKYGSHRIEPVFVHLYSNEDGQNAYLSFNEHHHDIFIL